MTAPSLLADARPMQEFAGLHLQRAGDPVDDVQVDATGRVVLHVADGRLPNARLRRQLDLRQAGALAVLPNADAKLKGRHTAQRRHVGALAPSRAGQPSADEASTVYDVVQPIARPILALPGTVLVVWPGHKTHALTVCGRRPAPHVLRYCDVAPELLRNIVREWEQGGVISPFSPTSALPARGA